MTETQIQSIVRAGVQRTASDVPTNTTKGTVRRLRRSTATRASGAIVYQGRNHGVRMRYANRAATMACHRSRFDQTRRTAHATTAATATAATTWTSRDVAWGWRRPAARTSGVTSRWMVPISETFVSEVASATPANVRGPLQ